MRGSDIIVEMLVAYGVEYVFGVPGDTSIRLYDSLYQRRDVITHVMARDERSAAFMADAYARLSGRPSVCESPSGAGALYTVPGVAEANASSVPVIALTSGIDLASEYKGVITELDHHMLYKTITKWSTFMKRYDKIPDTLRRAFRVATTGRPGAVHIAFPQEVLNAEIPGGEADVYAEDACRFYPTFRVRCERSEVDRAAEFLVAAERPVIVAGGGAINARAWHELTELAELLDAPVGTSISGKGAIAETHPLAIGVVGDNGYRDYANEIVAEADLLFYVGNKTGSVTTIRWTLPHHEHPPRIIQLDIDPELIGNNYPTEVGLVGDAKLILADLVAAVRERAPRPRPAVAARIAGLRAAWWKTQAAAMESDQTPIKPQRVMAALRRVLPRDAVVIADAGTPTPYVSAFLEIPEPGRQVIIPRAYGGLGYAIPARGGRGARPAWTCGGGSVRRREFRHVGRRVGDPRPAGATGGHRQLQQPLVRLDQGTAVHPLGRALLGRGLLRVGPRRHGARLRDGWDQSGGRGRPGGRAHPRAGLGSAHAGGRLHGIGGEGPAAGQLLAERRSFEQGRTWVHAPHRGMLMAGVATADGGRA